MLNSNDTSIPGVPHHEALQSRRDFLMRAGAGFGAIALAGITDALGSVSKSPRQAAAKAKSVIFLFMEGGPSHIDLYDPKPLLNKLAGKPIPDSFGKVITAMGEAGSPLLKAPRTWKQHGESGLWMSEWIPNIATCADDIAVIRSCVSDGINHAAGVCQMNTGHIIGGRPSLGSWVNYGLGTENSDLPAFVVLKDTDTQVVNGPRNWGAGFMPARYQGVALRSGPEPIANLHAPENISDERQRGKLGFLDRLNQRHASFHEGFTELDARIKSYELAFRMQAEAPGAVDLNDEPEYLKEAYGMNQKETQKFGRNCLLARRLVERGVRFVQLYHGSGSKWDSHSNIEGNHSRLCHEMDQPVATLLKDLKQRGLLDETLVVWGGEFGRTPMSEKGSGRDHNPTGFSMWMAGGGIKGGQAIGATDDLGLHATEDRLHVHDLHATVMHLLGIDHTKLIYYNKGRPERVDLNEGTAYTKLT